MVEIEIPENHPRKVSLEIREKIIKGYSTHEVATAGLLAHGRGEAFDYLIGEKTNDFAKQAIAVAVAALLSAHHPFVLL
jgi:4-phosphopantoate--beta-alanine ligase